MNDPGLDEPIQDAETEAKQNLDMDAVPSDDKGTTQQQKEEEEYISPAKWWYASTAFPLIAGTFGPMANAFSICALVENWRVNIPPGGTEEHGTDVADPKWLIAINAVSLVLALTANLSLLLNMSKRVRFEIAQPITILGFWIASILLIGLISYAGTSAKFHARGVQDRALTQAYYYAIYAASLYQIISYLMCITVWAAYRGSISKDFELTVAQRTLMLQTISFLVYMLLGALVYSHIESWKFLDAVYWADFTSLTIGLGQPYVPTTHLGRGLLFPFAIGSIIVLGLVVGSIRSLILERGAQKMSARMTEKIRMRVVKQVNAAQQNKRKPRPFFGIKSSVAAQLAQEPKETKEDELARRKLEFETMRKVQDMAARERSYISLALSGLAFSILWFVGAFVFYKTEYTQQWSYFESLYFAYTSVLTIGYGDFQPYSNSGKSFFVFWSLLAIPTLTILISNMGDTVIKSIKDVTIWLGEISVLPSTDNKTTDRLKHGIYKATLSQWKAGLKNDDEEDAADPPGDSSEWDEIKTLQPGLVKLLAPDKNSRGIHPDDIRMLTKFSKSWEESEAADEEEARTRHDKMLEAEHHYRRLLISHIPKIYADTKHSTPKNYSYFEWTFYLRLLGEDETDGRFHRRAIAAPKSTRHKRQLEGNASNSGQPETQTLKLCGDSTRTTWSWIGRHSPLMKSKDEADWILEKLFERLEESIKAQGDLLRQQRLDLEEKEDKATQRLGTTNSEKTLNDTDEVQKSRTRSGNNQS